jgi:mannosyl-oligosaccharide alpha-1,2-mannosidase
MHLDRSCLTLLGLVSLSSARPSDSKRQAPLVEFPPTYAPNPTRAQAVKDVYRRSWNGYYKYAFPHDSLKPITNSWDDDRSVMSASRDGPENCETNFDLRNGWGASAVDALSTALIMEDIESIDQILAFIPTINFSKTNSEVSLFETTIRYLGGLLSGEHCNPCRSSLLVGLTRLQGYDLLKGPLKKLALNTGAVNSLLDQATVLANNLKPAFDTPSGVPDNSLFFDPKPRKAGLEDNWLATIGTLVLEWTRLSDLTGDKSFGDLAQKGESYLLDPKPASSEPFPGMVGSRVLINNGTFADDQGSWNGGTDSFYEYLIKMYVYDAKRFAFYKDRWIKAADSSIKYLASHPTTRPDLTFLAYYGGTTLYFQAGHRE